MSHHDFEWKPGPKINLITGRNGAGKSSILQAIVIGLGEKSIPFLFPLKNFFRETKLKKIIVKFQQNKIIFRQNLKMT